MNEDTEGGPPKLDGNPMRNPTALLCFTAVVLATPDLHTAIAEQWKRHTIDSSDRLTGKRGADGVRLLDVNGDDLFDITTGWEEGGAVVIYLNPGPERARQRWPAVTVGSVKGVEDAVSVDLDRDGAVDVVSCAEGKINNVFVHWAPKASSEYLQTKAWKS